MTYMEFIYNKDIYQEEKMKCKVCSKIKNDKEQTQRFVSELLNNMDGLKICQRTDTRDLSVEAAKQNGYALEYVNEQTQRFVSSC